MDLGIFDHLDRREACRSTSSTRAGCRLLEQYDEAGFAAYHLAEHHTTPLGLAPVPGIFLAAAHASGRDASGSGRASTACRSTTRSG